jgi:hypothetical protein
MPDVCLPRYCIESSLKSPKEAGRTSSKAPSRDSHWRQFYDAALVELDPEVLARRVAQAMKAIQSRMVELRSRGDEEGEFWELIDALRVLDDLLKMNRITPRKE